MKAKAVFSKLMFCIAVILCCLCSARVIQAVKVGIDLSLKQLIPSLFLFLILSNLYPNCALSAPKASKLPPGFWGMLSLTLTGGYPVGALCIRKAYSTGTLSASEAKKLSLILFCCGPGFLIGYVGSGLCGDSRIGLYLYIAQILTVLLGIVCYLLFAKKRPISPEFEHKTADLDLSAAVLSAVKSMANICGTVIFFLSLQAVFFPLTEYLPTAWVQLLSGILEVTSGCAGLRVLTGEGAVLLMGFFCGFGGICVHLQICGILKECAPRYILFAAVRVISAILSVGIFKLMTVLFPISYRDAACMSIDTALTPQSASVSPTVFVLLISCSILLIASFFGEIGFELPQKRK